MLFRALRWVWAGGAERIAFNKMRNERNHPESVVPFGLLRGDNSRRPAFNAFRVVSTYFAGVQQASWLQLGNIYIVTLDRGGQTTTVLWNTATTPINYSLNAIVPEGIMVDERGNLQTILASNGVYNVQLPGAVCSNGAYCFIGGAPRLIVEAGPAEQRAPLLPLTAPTPTLTPLPVPTNAPLPTDTPLPLPPTLTPTPVAEVVSSVTDNDPPSEAEVPAPSVESEPPPADALPAPGVGETPPEAGALPDPDFDPFADETDAAVSSAPTPTLVPPVSLSTVLRPDRILWLLIIGLIVFTVSYGVQVTIWYRMKR